MVTSFEFRLHEIQNIVGGPTLWPLEESAEVEETTKRIDALFENSSNETHSLSEKQLVSSFMGEMGNMAQFVNAILGAVLFTLLFMTATTMGRVKGSG